MREVLAGWAAGYAMGLVSTALLAWMSRPGGLLERLRERLLPGLPPVGFAVPVFIGASLAWGLLGLLAGSAYRVGEFGARRDGLGSPSLAFTAIIVLLAIAPLPALVLLARREWWAWTGGGVAFAALFGWMLPLLAGG